MFSKREEYIELDYWVKRVKYEPFSKRMKVYQFPDKPETSRFINELKELGEKNSCNKIMLYIKDSEKKRINEKSFDKEGLIKGFFNGETAYIYTLFLNSNKKNSTLLKEEEKIFDIAKDYKKHEGEAFVSKEYYTRLASKADAHKMSSFYEGIFETYPTPINDPEFIQECMDNDVYFTVIEHNGEIVSACSAEIMNEFKAAEIADCGTLVEHQGNNLLSYQFTYLEKFMKAKGIKTLFSYSRSLSIGMNLVNKKQGFTYGGRLKQNSNICGKIENMNVWYKNL